LACFVYEGSQFSSSLKEGARSWLVDDVDEIEKYLNDRIRAEYILESVATNAYTEDKTEKGKSERRRYQLKKHRLKPTVSERVSRGLEPFYPAERWCVIEFFKNISGVSTPPPGIRARALSVEEYPKSIIL
jgi:hypothetical protein